MVNLEADIIDVVKSSRLPLGVVEVWQDVRVWPLHRGEPMRKDVTRLDVEVIVERLLKESKLEAVEVDHVVCLRMLQTPVEKPETKQMSLF